MSKNKKKRQNRASKLINGPALLVSYFKESKDELKKVTWPNRQTTLRYTVIVVAVSLFVGAVIGGVDIILQEVLVKII